MKRMMIATALATTLGTAAFAANETQMETVKNFADGVDTTTYTDSDFNIAYGIVTSGMSQGEKVAKLRALQNDDNLNTGLAMMSDVEMARLREYAPDVDLSTVTQAQAEAALAASYGANSEAEATSRVTAILTDENMAMDDETMAMITTGQLNMLQTYVPDLDVSTLSEDELQLALSYAYSGMSRSQKVQQIEALLN